MNTGSRTLAAFRWLPFGSLILLLTANAAPLLITNRSCTADGLSLGWNSAGAGVLYTVQRCENQPHGGLWVLPWAETPWPLSQHQWTDSSLPPAASTRFYRVVAVPAAERGKLLSYRLGLSLSSFEVAALLGSLGVPQLPQQGVRLYKIVYETIDPLGARTTASGALVLPTGATGPLPLLSYQHGTISRTNEAPSSMDLEGEVSLGIIFASLGYAAVLPDYLGLGDSPGFHPYHHARSEATASVDMLRAARRYCALYGVALTNRLFLCGYSQGGHATMALHRELEAYHTNEFCVAACAPMAGAYDLSGVTRMDFLSGRALPNPWYFAYLLAGYQEVYRLTPTLADLLAEPYNSTLPPLLYGRAGGGEINAQMPADPSLILKPEYRAALISDPRHPLRLALEDNDVYRWSPRAPMRLYHCQGDTDVTYENSIVAHGYFQAHQATQVQLIDPLPLGNHAACVTPSLLQARAWFEALR